MNKKKRPPPFSLRLTPEERVRLERDAAGMAMGEYIKWRVFHDSNPKRKVRNRRPLKDHKLIAQVLGMLGQSRIPGNINQLAKAANSGSLPVTSDTEKALREACNDIKHIRKILIEALGLKAE